jgi:hypothetical protein
VMVMYVYIYGQIITTSLFSHTGIMVIKGNHPQMAELFRLVKYYNLPRYIYIYVCVFDDDGYNI